MGSQQRRPVRSSNRATSGAAGARTGATSHSRANSPADNGSSPHFDQVHPAIDDLEHHGVLLRQVIQQAEIGMGLLLADSGQIIAANPALCHILGRSESVLKDDNWLELLAAVPVEPDGPEGLVMQHCIAHQRPDQSQIWLRYSIRALLANDNHCNLLLLQAEDISEQRQASALAQQEHELLYTLLTHIDASIYIKDRQGRYLYANPATLANLGVAAQGHPSILGLTDYDLLPLEIAEQLQQFDRQVLEHGGPLRREERLPKSDGSQGIFLSEKMVCGQQDGAGFLLGFSSEITELRRATEQLEASELQFRLLAENSGEVIFLLSSVGMIRWVSPSLTPTLGWLPEEWIGRSGTDFLVHRGETDEYRSNLAQLQEGNPLVIARDQVVARDGSIHWVETAASLFINGAGEADGTVARLRLVDDQVEAETKLRHSEERYRLLSENARDVIWTITADGEISYVSPSVQTLRGISPEQAIAQSLEQIHPAASRRQVQGYLQQVARECRRGRKPQAFRAELEYFSADGSTIWCDVLALPVLNDDGSLRYVLGTSRDITERKRYEQQLDLTNQQLHALASTDSLTGVCNRHRLQLMIQQLISTSAISGEPVAMILCDIDHFKQVNDRHGHNVGDLVLVEFCQRAQRCLRSSDRLGRWGGEEFLILVPQGTASGAAVLAEKVRRAIADEPFDQVGSVTASFGVGQRKPNESFATWFQRVDSLLYNAKAAGRDLVMVEQG
jgi:diguanylate cyclase (GGDEF)-like protein/PAS domain S-box-containing protein